MLNIGKIYRADSSYDPKPKEVDGLPNYYHETYVPGRSSQIIFERGIYSVGAVTGTDGISRTPLIIISSSPHKAGTDWAPWSDIYDPDHGTVTYYGDNKNPGDNPLKKGSGNLKMVDLLETYQSPDQSKRESGGVPVVFFERVRVDGRAKGNLLFHGYGILERAELITQYNASKQYFSNYRFTFCVFSLAEDNENFDWQWIIDRCDKSLTAKEANRHAPKSWHKWIQLGSDNLQAVRRNVSVRNIVKSDDQKPSKGSAEYKTLNAIYKYYSDKKRKHDFEWLALDVTRRMLEKNGAHCPIGWVTQKSSDGGIDFVLRMDVGADSLASIKIVVLGQAKCTDPQKPTNGNDVARTVARMKRGWIGSYVTTSFFSEAVQKEINEDKYPVILINGRMVAEIVNEELFRTKMSLEDYLDSIEGARESHVPDDILNY